MALFSVALAVAAPRFVAEDPAHARRAARAWAAATACAGREAAARDEVPIVVGEVAGGFGGRATVQAVRRTVWRDAGGNVVRAEEKPGSGLLKIQLKPDAKPSTTAHEVAHAWVSDGPPALVEGATQLLEACIARREPRALPPDPPRRDSLDTLVDLRVWTNPDDDNRGRSAGYAAAAWMFAALAEAVPEASLWRHGWTWEVFDAVLAEAGRTGELLRSGLAGGVETQRVLLGDGDGDGILGLREHLAGTHLGKWDSDGDGWWDGAPREIVERAVRLPTDRRPVCSGWAAGPLGATITARGGTVASRGARPSDPDVVVDGAPPPRNPGSPMFVKPGGSIALEARSAEATWAIVDGAGLVPDTRCATAGRWTLLAARGAEDVMAPLAAALERAGRRADRVLGTDGPRRFLWVGEPFPTRTAVDVQRVPAGWLDRGAAGEWDYVAAYIVAWERLPETALLGAVPGEVDLFEAFARTLVDAPPDTLLAALDAEDVADWTARAAACPGGWAAYLHGACGVLDVPDAAEGEVGE